MERNDTGEACIIPIILRPCDWQNALFGKLQALPENGRPVTTWSNRDEAFLDVAQGIRNVIKDLLVPRHPTTILHNIIGMPPPTDPRIIQQREQGVKEIYAKLNQPDITALVLTGIGGLGKSTLAALVYRYIEEQRFAGQGPFAAETLWFKIDDSVTMTDLGEMLCKALGNPVQNFGHLDPQSQAVTLFNRLNTTDKVRLIVLDQFENLLDWQTGRALPNRPGIGEWLDILNSEKCKCHVLLTSRPRPQGSHVYPQAHLQEYPVKRLNTLEGIELLRKQGVTQAQGTDEDLGIAVERCSGHALSLTLLANILHDHNLSLTILFKYSEYEQLWRGDIATNLLDYIYTKQLSEVQRKLLQAFSVYREAVSIGAAEALIDFNATMTKSQMFPAFKALLAQHLLQATGEGRYQLHIIVATYAQSHFEEEDVQANRQALQATHARAAQYYTQQATLSCLPQEKRRQVSDVHDLIEAIWQYCQAEQWREAYDLIEQESIYDDLNRWGGNTILLELYQLLLPLDKWRQDHSEAALIYNRLGEIYRSLGQEDPARQFCERGLDICRKEGDYRGEGLALNTLGRIYDDLGQKEEAIKCYEQALNIYQEIGDRQGEANAFNNLGTGYDDLGKKAEAEEYNQQALNIYQEIGDRRGQGIILTNLGMIYNARMPNSAQIEQALKYSQEAVNILREVRDQGREGWALSNLGRAYNALGQNEQAKMYIEQALNIFREVGDRRGEGWILNSLGKIYVDLGQMEEASKFYEQSLGILREVGDRWSEGNTLNNLGLLYADLGKIEQAREFYDQALRLRRVGDSLGKARTLKNLGNVCCGLGQNEEALKYYKEALTVCKEIEDLGGEGKTLEGIGILYLKKHRYDVALACFLLARSIFEEILSPYRDKEQEWIDDLHTKVGDIQFAELLARVQSQAYQIVERALDEGLD